MARYVTLTSKIIYSWVHSLQMAIIHHYFVVKLSFILQIPIIKRNKQVSYTTIQGDSKLDKPCDFPLIIKQ